MAKKVAGGAQPSLREEGHSKHTSLQVSHVPHLLLSINITLECSCPRTSFSKTGIFFLPSSKGEKTEKIKTNKKHLHTKKHEHILENMWQFSTLLHRQIKTQFQKAEVKNSGKICLKFPSLMHRLFPPPWASPGEPSASRKIGWPQQAPEEGRVQE